MRPIENWEAWLDSSITSIAGRTYLRMQASVPNEESDS